MRVRLMNPDRDFDGRPEPRASEPDLTQDLGLDTLVAVMSGSDEFLAGVVRAALVSGVDNEIPTVQYRQAVMRDCLEQPAVVRELYALAGEAHEKSRRAYFGYRTRTPGTLLWGAVGLLEQLTDVLRRVRRVAEEHAPQFTSPGFCALFEAMRAELDDEYLATVDRHLARLRFRHGVLLSARLGSGNESTDLRLRVERGSGPRWIRSILGRTGRGYSFHIDERDEVGARALDNLRDRGIDDVANAAAQAAEHVLGFFQALRTELAFYLSAVNLHEHLARLGVPTCWPDPVPADRGQLRAEGLSDVCLALRMKRPVVPNDVHAGGKALLVITGANQGGKSSLLRALGVAHLMMEAGMFVTADAFTASWCRPVLTHYRREEDAGMTMGKLDEELKRLSTLVDGIGPGALLLMNESFAATNEREGSEIARQAVTALIDAGVKVVYVTHLFEFAQRLAADGRGDTLFLRAERLADGRRTYRVVPGRPLETSYGPDLYRAVFEKSRGGE